MAVKTFTTGEVLTASDTNTYLANSGLVVVTPSSVTNGTLSGAQITIGTTKTYVDIIGCFSATYDNYVICWAGITTTNDTGIYANVISGTTAATGNWYGNTFYVTMGSTSALSNAQTTNGNQADIGGAYTTSKQTGVGSINAPYLAECTTVTYQNATNGTWRMGAFAHRSDTSYDGLRFGVLAGTMSGGTITIYGYRKG